MGTSMFWGAGVTLRFLLVLWVPVALGITDNATPTYLNAMVAVGIVVGAGAAAKLVTLETIARCMPCGDPDWRRRSVLLLRNMPYCLPMPLLLLIGMLGGFFVVPRNALLQERGKQTVGRVNAIAVQNLAGKTYGDVTDAGDLPLAVKAGAPVGNRGRIRRAVRAGD